MSKTEMFEIKGAKYVEEYKIRLKFNDGKEKIVDFGPFLLSARNPMTRKYRDIKQFKKFRVRYGDLDWNDMELCFPIADLYRGKIS
jgi:hypothetical protein